MHTATHNTPNMRYQTSTLRSAQRGLLLRAVRTEGIRLRPKVSPSAPHRSVVGFISFSLSVKNCTQVFHCIKLSMFSWNKTKFIRFETVIEDIFRFCIEMKYNYLFCRRRLIEREGKRFYCINLIRSNLFCYLCFLLKYWINLAVNLI